MPHGAQAEEALVGKQLVMRAQIIEAAQANGCHLHIDEGEQIAEALGMSRSEMKDVARYMLQAGEAGGKGAILTLSEAVCGKAAGPLPEEPEPIHLRPASGWGSEPHTRAPLESDHLAE